MCCVLKSESKDMPKLSDDNWKEIDARIKTATSIRWAHGLKNWGAAGAFVTACVAVAIFVGTQISTNSKFQGNTEEHFRGIELQLVSLRALTAANQPLKKQNQDAAKELLAQAKKKLTPPIPEATVQQAGGNFIEASSQDQGAWKVALDFVSYRSWLNVSVFPPTTQALYTPVNESEMAYYTPHYITGRPATFKSTGSVPLSERALLEPIDEPAKVTAQSGNSSLLAFGGTQVLDGMHFRHVVLIGVEVHYSGSPLVLEDVLFVDCTFVMDNDRPARTLGDAILASSKVTVRIDAV
jgi:hypothetical protein